MEQPTNKRTDKASYGDAILDAKLHSYHTRHVPNHFASLKFRFWPNLTKALPTDGRTDGPTNRPTDKASYRDADASKKEIMIVVKGLD